MNPENIVHQEETIGNPEVAKAYREAAQVVNECIAKLIKNLKPGKKASELCKMGDNFISERVKSFKVKSKNSQPSLKGPGFPTCINVNDIICNYSPLTEDIEIKKGDTVRMDVTAHIDGYIATAATTLVLTDDLITGKQANVFSAALNAQQVALRLMKPGHKNQEISEAYEKIEKDFDVQFPEGILSHQLKRFVIDGNQTIMNKKTLEQQVEIFEFKENEVYGLDIVVSSGNTKIRDSTPNINSVSIWKRQPMFQGVDLKRKSSQQLLSEITKKYDSLPFSMGWLSDDFRNTAKLGIIELYRQKLVDPYPVLSINPSQSNEEKPFVVQLKTTVLISSSSVQPITGVNYLGGIKEVNSPFVNKFQPEEQAKIKDKDLQQIMKSSLKMKKKKKGKKEKAMDVDE